MKFEKVAKILGDYLGVDPSGFTPETTFAQLELDSLDMVELIMSLEEEFSVTIETSQDIKTIKDVVDRIEKA